MPHSIVYGNVSYQSIIAATAGGVGSKPTSVPNIQTDQIFNVYPNPTGNILYLFSSKSDDIQELVVRSVDGRVLKVEKNIVLLNKRHSINTTDLVPGTYIISGKDKLDNEFSLKFIKAE